jgi:hypothetical protein
LRPSARPTLFFAGFAFFIRLPLPAERSDQPTNPSALNAYSIPLGGGLDYLGFTTPNSIFAFPAGQAISRTTYATLFALIGGQYGGWRRIDHVQSA